MKSTLRSLTTIGLALSLGTGFGVGLQKYANLSTHTGNLLRKVGLYHYFYSPTAVLKEQLNKPPVPERLQGKLKLYILVGQSNMVGAAVVPGGLASSANVFTFGNDYQWDVANEPVDSPINQIDSVSADPEAGFGPAFTFAKTLVARDNNQLIGLIPCAKDGSSITDWQRSLSDQALYGSCLKRVRAASPMGTVSGILFFQGEADTIDPKQYPSLRPDAEAWAEKFAIFAYNFRNDLGQPDLPLVYAQLGAPDDLEGLPNWSLVKEQQANIQIPNGTMIRTDDLAMEGIHFTVDSYRTIGKRFADAVTGVYSETAADANAPWPNSDGGSPPAESAQ